MKDNNAKLELLEKRRQSLKKELSDVSDEVSELVETKFLPEYAKRYADTYWVKGNGYDKENTWPIYTHVKAVKGIWDTEGNGINCTLVCNRFQCTARNEIVIRFNQEEYYYYLGKRITKKAYEKAKQALIEKFRSIF
jgi:hypothetical protein